MSEHSMTNNAQAQPNYLPTDRFLTRPSPKGRVHDEDASLVAGLRTRDQAAFSDLVRRYQRPLLSVALRISKNHEDAEEIIQDAFLRVFQRIESFRGESLFRTWLTRITINEALMKIRKPKRRYVSIDERGDDGVTTTRELKAAGYTPEESCSVREIESMGLSLLPKISLASQPVLKLCGQMELSLAEASKRLRLKPSTVKSRLWRGRKELRDAFARHCSQRKRYSAPYSQAA